MHLYGIFGDGGFGREIMPLVRAQIAARHSNEEARAVFVVEGPPSPGNINGHSVLSREEFLAAPARHRYFNIAISDSKVRQRIAEGIDPELAMPFSIEAQSHLRYDVNTIGEGAVLCAFSMLTSNARIGRFFHANLYSYVAHDCVIGDYVTLAPCVKCNGGVMIEDHAYIGTGAVIKQSATDKPIVIGRGAVVGMGAVVTKSVQPFTTVVGNPAKPLDSLV